MHESKKQGMLLHPANRILNNDLRESYEMTDPARDNEFSLEFGPSSDRTSMPPRHRLR